jgi:DNA-binding MarR family transcriptional regulator
MDLSFAGLLMGSPTYVIKAKNSEPKPAQRRSATEVRSEHQRVLAILKQGEATSRELEEKLGLDKSKTASLLRQLLLRELVVKRLVPKQQFGGREALWRIA